MTTLLSIAESAILETRRPLSAAEIVDAARASGRLPRRFHDRPAKASFTARLAEDVRKEGGRFVRTGPGRFLLRSLLNDPTIPAEQRRVFDSRRLQRRRSRQMFVSLDLAIALGCDTAGPKIDRLDVGQVRFAPDVQSAGNDFVPIWSIVYVTQRGRLLSYEHRRQKIGTERVFGRKALGFPAPVRDDDQTLFDLHNHGIVNRGITTLTMHVGANDVALTSRQEPVAQLEGFSLVDTHSGPLLIGIVHHEADDWFEGHARSLSVRNLAWTDPANDLATLRLDLYSRAVLAHLGAAPCRVRLAFL